MKMLKQDYINEDLKDRKIINFSQYGYMKKTCQANLFPFFDEIQCLVDRYNSIDKLYLDMPSLIIRCLT